MLYIGALAILLAFGINAETCADQLCTCYNRTVNCTDRNLSYIPRLPVCTEVLIMDRNNLPNVTADLLADVNVRELTNVSFRRCNMTNISSEALRLFTSLEQLDLSENYFEASLETMKVAFFGLQDSPIRTLILSSQLEKIEHLPDDLFEGMQKSNLTYFEMSDGFLKDVQGPSFSKLTHLKSLDLSNHFITSINFTGMESVQVLNLSLNDLAAFPDFCETAQLSNKTINLRILDISKNHISQLDTLRSKGGCLKRLTKLILTNNAVRLLKSRTFASLPSLEELYFDGMLVFEDILLQNEALFSQSLQKLFFGNYQEYKSSPEMPSHFTFLHSCKNLRVLDLTNIQLTFVHCTCVDKLLKPLIHLEKLVLQGNKLPFIPNAISNFTNLTYLDLSFNFIGSWNSSIFSRLHKLKVLKLSDNRIVVIHKNSFPPGFLHSIKELNLTYNPFSCTCELYWFLNWAKDNKDKLPGFPRFFDCYSPPDYERYTLGEYDPSFYECHRLDPYIIILIFCGTFLVLIFSVSCMIRKYRWHVRYYIYLLKSRSKSKEVPCKMTNTYLYDAFVAYCENDRSWVISNLMAVLEGQENFSLCLHERDFLPGRTIIDQISETIKHSRKVIFVLSNNFAKSQWCQYEILLTQNQLMENGGSALILVSLDEIQSKYLTNCLSLILKTLTHIEWTNQHQGKKLFWKKLIMSLKSN